MTGSTDLDEHAREAQVAFQFRTGRRCERHVTAPWMLSMAGPAGDRGGAVH